MLKKLLSFRFKYRVLLYLQKSKQFDYFKNTNIDLSKKQAYIFLAADYGNLGDVAITYAQTKFIENFSDFQVVEIPISKSLEGLWFVKKNIRKSDIITTVGGGNLGDMYDQIEFIRQLVVEFFPNNKIISFPQTFDFSETKKGLKALSKAKKVYNSHSNMHFIAREKTSFELMKKHFYKTNVYLTPDIVISLDKQVPDKIRKGAVICMRKDQEKNLSKDQTDFIIDQIKNRFDSVSYYDTHIDKNELNIAQRILELDTIWDLFRSSELVITDRLHGMIFCYITNTPCIVFQNNNHKVRETYYWIKNNTNINLVKNFSKEDIIQFFEKNNFNTGSLIEVIGEYQPLKNILK